MPGSIRSGLVIVLTWIAIGTCVTELMERRQVVLAMTEDTAVGWVSGVMSYVHQGFIDSDN